MRTLALVLLSALSTFGQSIWTNYTPTVQDAGAGAGVELGMQFTSGVSGTVTAIRFFKSAANSGTHTGSIWSAAGVLLGSVTFTGETPSGWQQMNLPSPVIIQPSTSYVVSYYAPMSHFAADQNYAWPVNSSPLQALGSFYVYGSTAIFPTQNYNATNYAVDLVFVPTAVVSVPPSVVLAWATVTTGTAPAPASWRVYRNGTLLATVTQQSYTDATVQRNGTVYTYTVSAVSAAGVESPQASISSISFAVP